MQIAPCRDGHDRRQVDVIVGVHVRLVGLREPGTAAVALFGVDVAHVVGIGA